MSQGSSPLAAPSEAEDAEMDNEEDAAQEQPSPVAGAASSARGQDSPVDTSHDASSPQTAAWKDSSQHAAASVDADSAREDAAAGTKAPGEDRLAHASTSLTTKPGMRFHLPSPVTDVQPAPKPHATPQPRATQTTHNTFRQHLTRACQSLRQARRALAARLSLRALRRKGRTRRMRRGGQRHQVCRRDLGKGAGAWEASGCCRSRRGLWSLKRCRSLRTRELGKDTTTRHGLRRRAVRASS